MRWLGRGLSNLQYVALRIVPIAGSKAAPLPFVRRWPDRPAKLGRRRSRCGDAFNRKTYLDVRVLPNVRVANGRSRRVRCPLERVNHKLETFKFENGVQVVFVE